MLKSMMNPGNLMLFPIYSDLIRFLNDFYEENWMIRSFDLMECENVYFNCNFRKLYSVLGIYIEVTKDTSYVIIGVTKQAGTEQQVVL